MAKVTQTANGPQINIVFTGVDCAYILSNVHYLNRTGEAVHFETGRKFAISRGKRVDFSDDGKIVYVTDDDTIYKCQYINEQKIKNKNVQKRKLCNLSRFIFYFFYFVFYSIGSTCNINNMRVMQ